MTLPHSISVTVGLLEAFQKLTETKNYLALPKPPRYESVIYGRDNGSTYKRQLSRVDLLERKLSTLKYVDEVCFDHTAWLTADLETTNFQTAQRRLATLKTKIESIMVKWAASLPDDKPRKVP